MKTAIAQITAVTAVLALAPFAAQAQTASPSASDLTRQLNGAPPLAQRQQAPAAAAPAPSSQTPAAPATARPAPAATAAPTAPPRPATASAAPQAGALSAVAIAALPFRIDLPAGVQLVEGRSGPDSDIYSVKSGARTLAMIYAGPSSQYPIYDGQQATVGGRTSVVVEEAGRRTAMEHLFQRETAPREIHVWLMSLDGADLAMAERIGQSVEPR